MKYNITVAKNELKSVVKQYMQKDGNGQYIMDDWQTLPIYLIGPAGIGKTQIVGEIARENNLGFVNYSLVHHTRQTMMGLPVIDDFTLNGEVIKETHYTMSEVLGAVYKQIERGYKEGILLLDEANCCPETIQPVLLSFLQSKMLGSSRLPKGWIIVLCGNPPRSIYNKNARAWDGALMDRLRVIELDMDHDNYIDYVYRNEFHPAVKYYLTACPDDAYICEEDEDRLNLVTYRSWENLSNALLQYEKLQLDVTDATINEYIKVDRVIEKFRSCYKYTNLNSAMDTGLWSDILKGELSNQVIKALKMKSELMIYGVTNRCFKIHSKRAGELLAAHEFLQKLKKQIQKEEYDITPLLKNSCLMLEFKDKIEESWMFAKNRKALLEGWTKELQAKKAAAAKEVTELLNKFEKLENAVLMRYYLNTISKERAWIYVMAGTPHKNVEQKKEKWLGEKKEVV